MIVVAVGLLAFVAQCWAARRRCRSFWAWPPCRLAKEVVDEGKIKKEGAWVTKTKVERDVNKDMGGEVQEGSTTMISNRR